MSTLLSAEEKSKPWVLFTYSLLCPVFTPRYVVLTTLTQEKM